MSTASLSICSSVKPGLRLTILSNYVLSPISTWITISQDDLFAKGLWKKDNRSHTVFVIPSVKRTNSILLPGPSHSGLMVSTSLRAEVCESVWS
jgi:ABC-type enterochelin transport system permease subunit